MSKWQRIALAVLVVGLCVWMPSHLPSCVPAFPTALFSYSERPRLDRKAIFSGRLGVLQPGFDTEYAVAAYFALTGRKFPGAGVTASGEAPDPAAEPAMWNGSVLRERSLDGQWQTFVNCGNDALRTVAATYNERRAAFGADSKWLADWITAQDAVFSNCSREGTLPAPVADDAPAMLRADREYQIAAAHFYAMRYDEARRRFLAIAADSQSPWRQIANVVAARCLIRKVTIAGAPSHLLEQAARELESIGTPGSMALRRFALLRVRPAAAGDDLGKALLDPRQRADFPHLLREYSHARGQARRWSMGNGSRIDLNRWVSALGDSKASLEGWNANRNAQWLVAALMSISPAAAEAVELEAEARKVSPSSPAYATVTYHRLRIAIATGRVEQARQDLDALLPALRTAVARVLVQPVSGSADEHRGRLGCVPAVCSPQAGGQ